MASRKKEELDIMTYRLDSIERRIELLERTLLTNKSESSSINSELLGLVVSMLKQQTPTHIPTSTSTSTNQLHETKECDAPITLGQSLAFARRKTIV